jgi:hypothetical protein
VIRAGQTATLIEARYGNIDKAKTDETGIREAQARTQNQA